jgi:hypothetical protein
LRALIETEELVNLEIGHGRAICRQGVITRPVPDKRVLPEAASWPA